MSLSHQADSLDWVSQMVFQGQSFEKNHGPVWLGTCPALSNPVDADEDKVDCDIMLPPLAWAVIRGLPHVAEALLFHGADPAFAFNLQECGGLDVEISISDLAGGWAEFGYRTSDCTDLIRAAIEARQISAAAPGLTSRSPQRHFKVHQALDARAPSA